MADDNRVAVLIHLSRKTDAWWTTLAKSNNQSKTYSLEVMAHKAAGDVAQVPGPRGAMSRIARFLGRKPTEEEVRREKTVVTDLGRRACYDGDDGYSQVFSAEWERLTKLAQLARAKTIKPKVLPTPTVESGKVA